MAPETAHLRVANHVRKQRDRCLSPISNLFSRFFQFLKSAYPENERSATNPEIDVWSAVGSGTLRNRKRFFCALDGAQNGN